MVKEFICNCADCKGKKYSIDIGGTYLCEKGTSHPNLGRISKKGCKYTAGEKDGRFHIANFYFYPHYITDFTLVKEGPKEEE